MRALVFFALESEARPFRRRVAAHPAWHILVTGIGHNHTTKVVAGAFAGELPALVLTCGFAGGLNPELARGTIVFDADPEFPGLEKLRQAGATAGRFLTSDTVVATAANKTALWKSKQADAVEMESSVIRQACRERGIPSATIRIVSDTAQEDLPLDFNLLMTRNGRMNYARLALALIQSPRKITELLAFQKRLQSCAQQLADCLATLVPF
jgi:nucleoside phosphorylase